MAGFSSVTGDESIMFADNCSFDGTQRTGKLTTDGQLFIGSTASPHIKKGSITSPLGTVTVGYVSPNITLDVANGGGLPLTPLKYIYNFDDFLSSSLSANSTGNLLWYTQNSVYGTGTVDHPGVVNFGNPGATSWMILSNNLSGSTDAKGSFVLGGGEYSQNFVLKLNALSTDTDTYNAYIGMFDYDSAFAIPAFPANDGIYFTYTNSVNSGNWQVVTVSSTVTTTTNTSVAADTNWHNFGFTVNANASSVTFTIDGVSVGTITTNIPTNNISPVVYHYLTAGTPLGFDVDLFYYFQTLTTARPGIQSVWPGSTGGPVTFPNWNLIQSTTIAGSPSTVTFNTSLVSYKRLMVQFINVVCSTQTNAWTMKLSSDNGATGINASSSLSLSASVVLRNGDPIPISSTGTFALGTAGVNGSIVFDNPSITSLKQGFINLFTTTTTSRSSSGSFCTTSQAAQINYIQITGDGTFNSGTVNIYGM